MCGVAPAGRAVRRSDSGRFGTGVIGQAAKKRICEAANRAGGEEANRPGSESDKPRIIKAANRPNRNRRIEESARLVHFTCMAGGNGYHCRALERGELNRWSFRTSVTAGRYEVPCFRAHVAGIRAGCSAESCLGFRRTWPMAVSATGCFAHWLLGLMAVVATGYSGRWAYGYRAFSACDICAASSIG